jgi:chloramphenicol 3-O-phosphotransferase
MEPSVSIDLAMGRAVILSGPPGSGKTTVGKLLSDAADGPTVHLATDGFYTAIRTGFVMPFLPEAVRQNEVVIGAVVDCMLAYARGGYDVVVDGIIGPWSLQPFRTAALEADMSLSFVVLRPTLAEALARAVARNDKALKASGPIRGLYGAFANLDALERHVIDSTGQNAEETAVQVRKGLDSGRFSLGVS